MRIAKLFIKISMIAIILFSLSSCEKNYDGIKSKVSFFPDGKTIIFSAMENGISNIYKFNINTKELLSITKNTESDYVYYEPSLSPDASKIVFSAMNKSKHKEGTQIYIMDSKGSEIERLTKDIVRDMYPIFTPDSKEIIFSRTLGFDPERAFGVTQWDADIYSMGIDGMNLNKITNRSFLAIGKISISPDGQLILFSALPRKNIANPEDFTEKHPTLIFLVNRYNPEPLKPFIVLGTKSNLDPSFSPDGSKIAFVSFSKYSKGFIYNVFTMDKDKKNIKQVTDNDSFNEDPVFSPDMKTIIFLSDEDRDQNYQLMQVNIDGTNLREINIFNK